MSEIVRVLLYNTFFVRYKMFRNSHPLFQAPLSPNTKISPHTVWASLSWIGGTICASIPLMFAIGTADEYINKTSNVPLFVPFLMIGLCVFCLYFTSIVAKLGRKKEEVKEETKVVRRKRTNHLSM